MSLTKTATGAVNQIFCMDGTTAIKDAIHNLALPMTGGVSNAWTESANFRTLLGASAPVIAQATTNKLLYATDNSTFEGNTVGGWTTLVNCSFANSTDQAYHGTHSGKMTVTANGVATVRITTTGIIGAGVQYTISARFKGVVGRTYSLRVGDDGTGGAYPTGPAVVADGTWQIASVTKTSPANSTVRYAYLHTGADALAGDIVYWDAVQLETGAVKTPYCVDSADDAVTRTACTMTIPTATIGLTAGQAFSAIFVVRSDWQGDDGVTHYLFDNQGTSTTQNRIILVKSNDNKLSFYVFDNAPASKICSTATLTAATWAADVVHIIVITRTAAGVMDAYLDGVPLATLNSGAGTGLETVLGTNCYFGSTTTGTYPLNGSMLTAIWGRVLINAEIGVA